MSVRDPLLLALALALVTHGGLAAVVAKSPAPEPFVLPPPDRTEVRTFEADVELPKPPPPRPPKPPEPPPKPPEPPPQEPPPPTDVTRPAEPAPAPSRPPRPATKKPAAAKPVAAPALRLANLAPGTGSVRTYAGSDDSYGAPDERATPENEESDNGPRGDGPRDAKGTAPSGGGGGAPQAPSPPPTAPKVKVRAPAVYPAGAPRPGKPISLTLALDIDAEGRVIGARVVSRPRIAGNAFDAAALSAAKATTFKPGTRGGEAVPWSIRYVVRFEVDGQPGG